MRVSWPVAVTGWRGGVWRGGGYGGGDTPATGTRIARLLPPPCRHAAGPRHHAATSHQPHLRWPTLCILTPSLHLKFHFKLNPHYTTSRLHEGWWSSPSTQHTCSQAPVNTLLSVQKYDVCVGELNYWYLERCKDAEQRGHCGHEPGRQLKLKSSSDDRLMPGWAPAVAMYADFGLGLGQGSPDLLQTTTHSHTATMNIAPRNILEVKNI